MHGEWQDSIEIVRCLDQIEQGCLTPWGQMRFLGSGNAGSICVVWWIPWFGGYVVAEWWVVAYVLSMVMFMTRQVADVKVLWGFGVKPQQVRVIISLCFLDW